jgi:hypothetical protein
MTYLALNPDRIGDAGRQLFGERWQTPLANALGVDQRRLRYWLSSDEQPSLDQLHTLIALLDRSAKENRRLADYLRSTVAPSSRQNEWTFGGNELKCLDRLTVMHKPSGSKVYFYEYVEEPPADYIPGGTITNSALWTEEQLVQFNTAAWKLLSNRRYGPDIRDVRYYVRNSAYKMSISEIVRLVQRRNPSFTEQRVRAALKDMEEMGEIAFNGANGIERLADPSPIVRR